MSDSSIVRYPCTHWVSSRAASFSAQPGLAVGMLGPSDTLCHACRGQRPFTTNVSTERAGIQDEVKTRPGSPEKRQAPGLVAVRHLLLHHRHSLAAAHPPSR